MRSSKINTKCGLGLRLEQFDEILQSGFRPDFWEVTPENWIYMPQLIANKFQIIIDNIPIIAHSVTLSIGSNLPPTKSYLKKLKTFLDRYNIVHYSDHISFSNLNSHQTHELLPLPMNLSMLELLCQRVDYIQNILKRELILENATYYYVFNNDFSECEFINELCKRSGAKLLLDINNVYVNSVNHNFDRYKFLDDINIQNIAYIHIAGHLNDIENKILIDTHGENVSDAVWEMLEYVLKKRKIPAMIERDNNIPPLKDSINEYTKLVDIWSKI